jgi:hypothetical protein
MAFAPGQFITAQRLNRLQPKTYWAAASAVLPASSALVDITGTSIPITIETDGATVAFTWSCSVYASGAMASSASARPFIGADGSPVFALGQWNVNTEKGSVANVWSTTVATAGAYTAKLVGSTPSNATLSTYTSLMVVVTEVA